MRDFAHLSRRVHGRENLERRLRALLIHAGRFSVHRARSAADKLWAARVVDSLRDLLPREPEPPGWQSDWESDPDDGRAAFGGDLPTAGRFFR